MEMIDREKLIKALEQHCDTEADCNSCPYEELETSIKCRDSLLRDCLEALKEQPEIVRCNDCKHLFDGEHTKNCCDVLMEKAGWLKEISVSPDWFCADGKRRTE